jgi:hypothetical protein
LITSSTPNHTSVNQSGTVNSSLILTKAGISANTVSRFENGEGAMVETLIQIQAALEKAGIVSFLPTSKVGRVFGCATFPKARANEDGKRSIGFRHKNSFLQKFCGAARRRLAGSREATSRRCKG